MRHEIPYYENLTESFQSFNLESNNPDFELTRFEDLSMESFSSERPFRVNAFLAGLFTGGHAKLTINSVDHILEKNTLYFSSPWHVRRYNELTSWQGYLLMFTPQFFIQYPQADTIIREFPFFQSENGAIIPIADEDQARLTSILDEMYRVLKSEKTNRFKILFHYLNIFLLECKEVYQQNNKEPVKEVEHIINKFQEKLNDYFTELNRGNAKENLSLTSIAQQLHLHPNYLSNLIKAQSGKTVSQIIRERMVLEAKALLRNSHMTISEIAYFLLFKDTSNFAKFFKNNTGQSPSAFKSAAKSGT